MGQLNRYLVPLVAWLACLLATGAGAAPVDNRLLGDEADGTNWAASGRTYSEDHFSPLRQITDRNIARMKLAWFYDLPVRASVYTTPLAVDGTLYFAVSYSIVRAMDAATGRLLWEFDPKAAERAGESLRGGWGVRGIAFWKGRIYTGTHDGRLIALDAKTGQPVWSVQTTEPGDGRYISAPPRVFNGKVVVGFGGGDFNVTRGYLTAYDANSGRELWRFYTVPGDPTAGAEDPAMAMAAKTWHGEYWKVAGGAAVWNAMVYDPQFNRVYIGTGNGQPWNDNMRTQQTGDNLFVASIVALDADTGQYLWHYQVNPRDAWDYDANLDLELATLDVGGKRRAVLMQASKNGFFYVIDRRTGKPVSAEKYARVNWAERIDLRTGRPVEIAAARMRGDSAWVLWPSPFGAHSTQPMAYSPVTQLMYLPAIEMGYNIAQKAVDIPQWMPKRGMFVSSGYRADPPEGPVDAPSSALLAWDPARQRAAWRVALPGIVNGGALATAGNLVFQGRVDGILVAYAADNGKSLWSFDAQAGIVSPPITYLAGGRQYVTLVVGYGGDAGLFGAAFGWEYYSQRRRVLTFALDGAAMLPPAVKHVFKPVPAPEFVVDPAKAGAGAQLYSDHCWLCHGVALWAGGSAPDLRESGVPLLREPFDDIVRNGSRVPLGMPAFPEFSATDLENLQHFIRQQTH